MAIPPRAMREMTSYRPSTRRPTSGSVMVAPTGLILRAGPGRTRQRKRVMRVWTLATYTRVSANIPLRFTEAAPW